MDNIFEMLKELTGKLMKRANHEGWIQVGKLNPEDKLRLRNIRAETTDYARECEVLMAKITAIKARSDVQSREWWSHIYKTYGLPDGNYTIENDGRILAEPKDN